MSWWKDVLTMGWPKKRNTGQLKVEPDSAVMQSLADHFASEACRGSVSYNVFLQCVRNRLWAKRSVRTRDLTSNSASTAKIAEGQQTRKEHQISLSQLAAMSVTSENVGYTAVVSTPHHDTFLVVQRANWMEDGHPFDVALAYSRVGNQERFNEAMQFIERHAARLDEQSIDNVFYSADRAIVYALRGDADLAIEYLQQAASRGWTTSGVPSVVVPALAVLADDPRYQEIELLILSNMNRDREIVGLPPLNANYEVEPVQ